MDTITVDFTEEDAAKAKEYYDNVHCLLGTALQRLGHSIVFISGSCVRFEDGKRYRIDPDAEDKLADDSLYPDGLVGSTATLTYLNQWKS